MMISQTSQLVVDAALSFVGTPYAHQGRFPGLALDCAGLVICAAQSAGIAVADVAGYSRVPDGVTFLAGIEAQMDRINMSDIQPGDVIAFTFLKDPQHAAVVTAVEPRLKITHAHMRVRKTVEHDLDETWSKRICGAYRFRGI